MTARTVETNFLMTAQDRASAIINGVRGSLDKVGISSKSLSSSLAALGVGLSAGAFTAFVKSGIDAADNLAKTSQRVGVTVESLSALQYAAQLSDVSVEQLQGALTKLSRSASDAASGSKEQAEAFAALGVSVKNSGGELRGTEELLLDLVEKFAGLQDGSAKTALAMKVFGKSGAEIIPFLNSGREGIEALRLEAEKLGIIVSTETAKAAEQFNDNLTRLSKAADGLKFSLVNSLLPSLVRLTDGLADVAREGTGVIGVLKALSGLSPFGDVQRAERELVEVTDRLLLNQSKLNKLGTSSFADAAGKAIEQKIRDDKKRAEELIKLLGVLRGETDAFGEAPKAEAKKPKAPTLTDSSAAKAGDDFIASLRKRLLALEENEYAVLRLEAAQKGVANAAEPLIQQLQRETEFRTQLKQAQDQDRAAAEQELTRRQGLINGVAEYVQGLEEETSAMKLSNEERLVQVQLLKLQSAGLAEASEEYKTAAATIRSAVDANAAAKIFDDTRTPLEKYQQQLATLNRLADQGRLDWDTYERAVRKAEEALTGVADEGEKTKTLVEELGLTFSSAFEDALTKGGKLRDLLKGLEQDLIRVVTRKLVTEPLGNFVTDKLKGFSGGGDFFGSILSSVGRLFGAGAMGIPAAANKPKLVGENGPELFVPSVSGTVLPNGRGLGGSDRSINININMPPGSSRETALQAATRVGQAVQVALRRNG